MHTTASGYDESAIRFQLATNHHNAPCGNSRGRSRDLANLSSYIGTLQRRRVLRCMWLWAIIVYHGLISLYAEVGQPFQLINNEMRNKLWDL